MKKIITIFSLLMLMLFPLNLWAMCECDMWVGSTTEAGLVELATDAETVTGTSDLVVTTPGNITARLAEPGAIGGTTPAAGTFTALTMNDDSSLAAAKHLVLPLHNDAATPTLGFGDGNTGFYESADNTLNGVVGGTVTLTVQTGIVKGASGRGAFICDSDPSATNPSVVAHSADSDTGIGRPAGDQLSLIAGGAEGIRITEATPLMSYQKMPVDNTHGGYIERTYYATSGTLAGATDKIELNIPTNWVIRACQLHVKTTVVDDAGDDTWSSELNDTGQEEVISTGSAAAQNTNVVHFAHADAGYGGTLTDAETDILLTPQGGNFTAGEIEAHCLCFGFDAWDAE